MKRYALFIDESGKLEVSNNSSVYVLCGCSILEENREVLKILADQIKFKYWGRTDIVFHSREIGRNEGDFEIFKDKPELKESFIKDLLLFLNSIPVIIFTIVIDKDAAYKLNWNEIKIVKETSNKLIYNFITFLLSKPNTSGHIIIESANSKKDKYYLNSFSYFLSPNGAQSLEFEHTQIRKILTSISFVTKNNFDIEEQISDLFAYAAACKFQKERKTREIELGSYEDSMINLLESKLFRMPQNAKNLKKKLFEKIDSFYILPQESPEPEKSTPQPKIEAQPQQPKVISPKQPTMIDDEADFLRQHNSKGTVKI
jgi:hypothetical protein